MSKSESDPSAPSFSAQSDRLRQVTADRWRRFDVFRRTRLADETAAGEVFWDYVVVTAGDEDQAEAFRLQIDAKLQSGELPRGCQYHVVPDPPGYKIGCGGSTLFLLRYLEERHGTANMDAGRVFVCHAGGYSQRLPNASVMGKVFTALPLGDPMFHVLEMKLASFIDFPRALPAGAVFCCAGDTFELFDLGTDEAAWSLSRPGVTALGHPSSLEIGTTHGVFVLAETPQADLPAQMAECQLFLHKETREKMHSEGAVVAGGEDEEPFVYTDSAFSLDRTTARTLLALYDKLAPITSEVDAYGDFLQALGTRSTPDYCGVSANVVDPSDSALAQTRRAVYDALRGTPMHVLLLNPSRFYHFGTLTEYIHHLCCSPVFHHEVSLERTRHVSTRTQLTPHKESNASCFMHVCGPGPLTTPLSTVVLEYTRLTGPATIHAHSLVSSTTLPPNASLPPYSFLHTAATRTPCHPTGAYVTLVFHIRESLKGACDWSHPDNLPFCASTLSHYAQLTARSIDSLFVGIDRSQSKCALYLAQLFPVCDSMELSVEWSLWLLNGLSAKLSAPQPTLPPQTEFVSFSQIVTAKAPKLMMAHRESVCNETKMNQ